ncbi:MAG: TPM domain-containing protein [Reichenbachiella sp.]
MSFNNIKILFTLFGIVAIPFFAQALGNIEIPPRKERVTDLTNTLSVHELEYLNGKLEKLEQAKGSQIAVLIVNTTDSEKIEQYSLRVTEQWKLGREGVGDGILLLIAKADRKLKIEVGYGLEEVVPEIYTNRIIDNLILPAIRGGKFSTGIDEGVDALIALLDGEKLPGVTQMSNSRKNSMNPLAGILIASFIIGMIANVFKNKKIRIVIGIILALLVGYVFSSIFVGVFSFIISLFFSFGNFDASGRGSGDGDEGSYSGGGYRGSSGYSGGSSGGASGSW